MKIEKTFKEVNKENHKWWHEKWWIPFGPSLKYDLSSSYVATRNIKPGEINKWYCDCGYELEVTILRKSEL